MSDVEAIASTRVTQLLSELLGEPVEPVAAPRATRKGEAGPDLYLRGGGWDWFVEVKGSDARSTVESAHAWLNAHTAGVPSGVIPLLVVPKMGPAAQRLAKALQLSWLDLTGAADVRAPGLRLRVDGGAASISLGRAGPSFSPSASRISRILLMSPGVWWRQTELVARTGLSAGYVSKVVRQLTVSDLVRRRASDGAFCVTDRATLLDAWAAEYDLSRHHVERFHTIGRSGLSVLMSLAERLDQGDQRWAATGLAAAWMYTEHADFRLVSLYAERPLMNPAAVGLRSVERGENVWVLTPNDPGVFDGVERKGGVPCVHPVQAWLDLAGHPERSAEAAEALRAQILDVKTC